MHRISASLIVALAMGLAAPAAAGLAAWDVAAEMAFAENGVVYRVDAGLPIVEKLCGLELREPDRVHDDEIAALGQIVAEKWPELVNLEINGAPVAPKVLRFGIQGERDGEGVYRRRGSVARLEILHESPPPLMSVSFDWRLLPERYFESGGVEDLAAHLELRDRSAIVGLHIGEAPRAELEMRDGQADYAWERAGESLSAKTEGMLAAIQGEAGSGDAKEEDPPPDPAKLSATRGRIILAGVLAVLIVLRLVYQQVSRR